MAQQDGIIPLKGTIDNINFYRTADGYKARKKSSLSKDRIAKDPNFERTREAMGNFGKAGNAGKLLRTAFRPIAQSASDSKVASRLAKEMVAVIKADITNPRGKKNVIDGETELLTGFDFNAKGKLSTTFFVNYDVSIERATGILQVKVPAFVPKQMIAAPVEATHFQLHMAGAEVDFEKGVYTALFKSSDQLVLSSKEVTALDLVVNLNPNSTHPLFLALGINFFIEDIDTKYQLKNGAFNALAIIKVSGAV